MAEQAIDLPRARYQIDGPRYRRWTWAAVISDIAIDSSLLGPGATGFLLALEFFRTAKNTPRQRTVMLSIGASASASASQAGDDLSSLFESQGSITVTLDSGESISLRSSNRADQSEPYVWTSADEEYTDEEFDAVFDNLNTGNFQQAGHLAIRDFEPPPPDITPPQLVRAATDRRGRQIFLTYNEELKRTDVSTSPPASAFRVVDRGLVRQLDPAIDVAESNVSLTVIGSVIPEGAKVSVAYTQPATRRVQDAAGNDAPSFPTTAVENRHDNTPPTIVRAELAVASDAVLLRASEPVAFGSAGSNQVGVDFTVEIDGTRRTVSAVAISDDGLDITLSLSGAAVQSGAAVTVAYAPGGVARRIQDRVGNDMAAFAAIAAFEPFGTLPLTFTGTRNDLGDYTFEFAAVYHAGSGREAYNLSIDPGASYWELEPQNAGRWLDRRLEAAQMQILRASDNAVILSAGRLSESRESRSYVGRADAFPGFSSSRQRIKLRFGAHAAAARPLGAYRGRKLQGMAFGGRKISGGAFGGRKFAI